MEYFGGTSAPSFAEDVHKHLENTGLSTTFQHAQASRKAAAPAF